MSNEQNKTEPKDFKLLVVTKQTNGKPETWCCVECLIGNTHYETKFHTISTENALSWAQNNFNSLSWREKKKH